MLARAEAGIQGSRLVLLSEFLKHTAVEVSYIDRSVVSTESGLPEGGMLGPICYPLLPRLLDKSLAAAGAGVGVTVPQGRRSDLARLHALDPGSA